MIPKWEPRAQMGVYVGQSPSHASNVALVLNSRTGHVLPQFHVVFVGTLKDGYIRNVPLPRVPRIQSDSLTTLEPSRCIMAGHEPSRCIMAGHAPAITYYSRVPRVPTWSDLTSSLSGFGRRTLLPFSPVRLM